MGVVADVKTQNAFVHGTQAMVGTGEALLNIRAKDGKGATASVPTAQEFDFQSELQKFDKVNEGGRSSRRVENTRQNGM